MRASPFQLSIRAWLCRWLNTETRMKNCSLHPPLPSKVVVVSQNIFAEKVYMEKVESIQVVVSMIHFHIGRRLGLSVISWPSVWLGTQFSREVSTQWIVREFHKKFKHTLTCVAMYCCVVSTAIMKNTYWETTAEVEISSKRHTFWHDAPLELLRHWRLALRPPSSHRYGWASSWLSTCRQQKDWDSWNYKYFVFILCSFLFFYKYPICLNLSVGNLAWE